MRLSQLEYFIKVAECGSITKAAQELFLSQPSLTKSIAGLEAQYNVRLFERTAKGITVTPQGQEFLEYAKAAVDACKALDNTFGSRGIQKLQRLRIASQQFAFLYPLVEKICRETLGAVHFDIEETDRGHILDRILKREADIGILVLSENDSRYFEQEVQRQSLQIHTLDYSPTYVSMGVHSPFFGQYGITAEQASTQLHVVLDTEKSMRRNYSLDSENHYVNPSRLIFCNTIGACIYFLQKTDAMLYTPKWVLDMMPQQDIFSTILQNADGSVTMKQNRLVWVSRKDEILAPLASQFLQYLQGIFPEKHECGLG